MSKRIPWNKGLTKETDSRILSGEQHPNYGKPRSAECKEKISKSLSLVTEINEKVKRFIAGEDTYYCKCGCGNQIVPKKYHISFGIPEYLPGHNKPWNKGLTDCYTEETLYAMGNGRRGKPSAKLGKTFEQLYGEKKALEIKQKESESKQGATPWNKGKSGCFSDEARQQMSQVKLGTKNWNYIDGSSESTKYNFEFKKLKPIIRKRDNYGCQLCGKEEKTTSMNRKKKFEVHHIDYNKENNAEDNLITLCDSCHMKTNNKRRRKEFTEFFKTKISLIKESEYLYGMADITKNTNTL